MDKEQTLLLFENMDSYSQLEVLERMELVSLLRLCKTSRYFRNLCENEYVIDIINKKKGELSKYIYIIPLWKEITEKTVKDIFSRYLGDEDEIYLTDFYIFVITYKDITNLPNTIRKFEYRGEKYFVYEQAKNGDVEDGILDDIDLKGYKKIGDYYRKRFPNKTIVRVIPIKEKEILVKKFYKEFRKGEYMTARKWFLEFY